jgi:succinoglycan biosynthesis protein ExoW
MAVTLKGDDYHSTRVAVIIPYYQRQAGILCRCLRSIVAQRVNSVIRIHIIVVDDASPYPADEEIGQLQIPDQITVEVVERQNGGPGAARNSGLDRVPCNADFIAFIDSDDTWRDDHLQRAVSSLGKSNDVYFSDFLDWERADHFNGKQFGTVIRKDEPSNAQCRASVSGVRIYASADLIPHSVMEFIAHASSVVYRTGQLSSDRFNEKLRWAGEDDVFLLSLLLASDRACVSSETEVELGFGENIFLNSFSWDSENNLKRMTCQTLAQVLIRRRCQGALRKAVSRRISIYRTALAFFLMRSLLKGRVGVVISRLRLLFCEDPVFLALLPAHILDSLRVWAVRRLRGKTAFPRESILH